MPDSLHKRLEELERFNDEQIAARRGPMGDWVRYEDVLAALDQRGGASPMNQDQEATG